jgi:hypothetical protein
MSEFPPITLKADGIVGLFTYCDEDRAEEFRECLESDDVEFSFNSPEATHLAVPGKAVLVFGRKHPRVVARLLERIGEVVMIDPDVVITEDLYHPPVKQLLSLGELRRDEKRDYAALGISENDIPTLIRMATDYQLHGGPQDSPVVWAPVHAWRALTQLRAEEAIAPLVQLFRRLDADMDDWVSEDLPKDLGLFGEAALEPLTAYLADATHGDWSRVAAAQAIGHVGQAHPELRLDSIARLSAQLDRFAEQSETLNAYLVSPLWDLRAVEAMPVIERAFTSGRVDESVMGDVEDVQIHFGLKTRREHPPKPNKLTIMGERFRAQWKMAGLPLPDANGNGPEVDAEPPMLSEPYIAPPKIGRNEPCPCGSGKKYKKCCGA